MTKTKNNAFLNTLASDYYKITKLKSVYIAVIIMLFMLVITFASIWTFMSRDIETDITGKDYLFSSLSTANIGLFIAIIAGIFIGKEFSDGMMRIYVARGTKKIQIYFSKFIVLMSLMIAYSIVILILGGIFTAITGYGAEFTGHEFALLLRMLGLEILALISSTSIFIMFSFLLRSAGSTIGACIGFYLIISIISSVLTVISSGYLEAEPEKAQAIAEIAYFLPYQQSSIASSYDTISATNLVAAILMPIIYTIISTIIGVITFIKRDIK